MQPRVRATTVEWCWFKNDNDNWCMTGLEEWKIEYVNKYELQSNTDENEVPPNLKHILTYKSTQSASWTNLFSLSRLMTTNTYLEMAEFATGIKFELYYWMESYAFCLNLVHFIEPVSVALTTEQSVVKCKKTLISCFDDWSAYTDEEAKFMECEQSSSSAVTLYSYKPIEEEINTYLLGEETFIQNYCWPGFSPFYSYFYQYPTNFYYAIT